MARVVEGLIYIRIKDTLMVFRIFEEMCKECRNNKTSENKRQSLRERERERRVQRNVLLFFL